MKVGPTGPRISPPSVRRVEESRTAKVEAAPAQASPPREISDSMTIMGIPEVELTPRVRQALMTLMEEVQNLRRDLQRTSDRLTEVERLADQDSLTPTANRRAFVRELSRAMSQAERYGTPASVVYFDIDSFKGINDTHGHAAGDAALMHVVDIVMRHIRDTDVVGRLGGDEFGVILSHADEATTMEKAEALVSDIRTTAPRSSSPATTPTAPWPPPTRPCTPRSATTARTTAKRPMRAPAPRLAKPTRPNSR
jgi:diguanylate cyclase (GGDEF)-like protein